MDQLTITAHRQQTLCGAPLLVGGTIFDIALTKNRLYIYIIQSSDTVVAGNFISSGGRQWDLIAQTGDSNRRIEIYRHLATADSSDEDITSSWAPPYTTSLWQLLYEIRGIPIGDNGVRATVQVVIDGTTGADPSITMAPLRNHSLVMAAFSNSTNPFGGTPEAGWTEIGDSGCADVSEGFYAMTKIGGTDNTPTVTAASSDWIGVAIEFMGGRRTTVIN